MQLKIFNFNSNSISKLITIILYHLEIINIKSKRNTNLYIAINSKCSNNSNYDLYNLI